jgi:hypothetical protein
MPESRARKGPLQPRCRVLRADEARDSGHGQGRAERYIVGKQVYLFSRVLPRAQWKFPRRGEP